MKFKILDKNWEIIEVQPHDHNLYSNNFNLGTCFALKREIYINKELTPEVKREVLLHELTHAFLSSTQLNYGKDYPEEEVCEFVALYSTELHKIADRYLNNEVR